MSPSCFVQVVGLVWWLWRGEHLDLGNSVLVRLGYRGNHRPGVGILHVTDSFALADIFTWHSKDQVMLPS